MNLKFCFYGIAVVVAGILILLAFGYTKDENPTYISVSDNIVILHIYKGNETENKTITATLVNPKDSSLASNFSWNTFSGLNGEYDSSAVSITSNGDKCVLTPVHSGTACIRVRHSDAPHSLNIIVRVVFTNHSNEISYKDFDRQIIVERQKDFIQELKLEANNSYKVYISGKITGDKNAEVKFKKLETQLKALGYEPVNPFEEAKSLKKQLHREPTYKEYIDFTLKLLMNCKAIYMLKDWSDSKGACLEYNYAKICGLEDITDDVNQELLKF